MLRQNSAGERQRGLNVAASVVLTPIRQHRLQPIACLLDIAPEPVTISAIKIIVRQLVRAPYLGDALDFLVGQLDFRQTALQCPLVCELLIDFEGADGRFAVRLGDI